MFCAIFLCSFLSDLYLGHKRPRYLADGNYNGGIAFSSNMREDQLSSLGHKRPRFSAFGRFHSGRSFSSGNPDETVPKKPTITSKVVDFSDPLATRDFLGGLDCGKFGSVTNEIKALLAQKMLTLYPYFEKYPTLISQFLDGGTSKTKEASKSDNQQKANSSCNNVIDLDDDCAPNEKPKSSLPIITIDSDEEDKGGDGPSYNFESVFSCQLGGESFMKDIEVNILYNYYGHGFWYVSDLTK